ncbi:liprin-beta-2 isoform X2 [Chelonus insularis]|uniref:liprin-beta-2 isoform X2 n=1 Tax=Chelonus insularis TaxID=460826 RepID=UPI00158BE034|nr:liprin-beta-2 isoform X2 [Chelonus insularis]
MEGSWTNGHSSKNKDLQPIMEEDLKIPSKESQSDSSDATSTVKQWSCRWTPSEVYDSSGSSSEAEKSREFSEYLRSPMNSNTWDRQNDLSRARSFRQSSKDHLESSSCRESSPFDHHSFNGFGKKVQPKCFPTQRDQLPRNSVGIPGGGNGRGSGVCSLDRRRRRLRNRNERDQRAKSQSDLIYCERDRIPLHYCSLQQFHCQYASNSCINCYNNNTEERLRKLENDRAGLNLEVAVLSEQVDAQSSKILELENLLQEKKDSLRQLENALQKEILSKSALETQKLELLTSLSEMKLKQASLEHENLTLRNATSISNGEKFSRHTGQYSSLPRPPTVTKKGVAFGKLSHHLSPGAQSSVINMNMMGTSSRCLSAPILAEEEKIVINEINQIEPTPSKLLSQLSIEEIESWLSELGLESYAPELRRWGATGSKLMDITQHQIEKELDIKNSLHRKKLLYAVECERSNGVGFLGSEKMDSPAVLRWLDDIGLPQHKEAFQNAKVDGRVLHRLTTEDLLALGVTAQLHAASLRRGIQVLRELNFQFDNLERRSPNGDGADGSNVALWTNHRVMEWLRVVDLAEYAPNMRGSGVHGGLMVHEGRFTSELLATLLSIPPAKTLLRRHLTTHFNQVIGRDVVQQKREVENTLGFVPLTLTARLKVPKKSQFTLKRKKSKSEIDYGNLVCPLEASPPDMEIVEHRKIIGCI